MPQLSQSTILVGALLAAFIVYLAMNGRLNAYWALLTGSAAGATATSSTGSATTGSIAGSTGLSSGLTGSTTGVTPGTSGGLAAPGGFGGPLSITVHPLGNIAY